MLTPIVGSVRCFFSLQLCAVRSCCWCYYFSANKSKSNNKSGSLQSIHCEQLCILCTRKVERKRNQTTKTKHDKTQQTQSSTIKWEKENHQSRKCAQRACQKEENIKTSLAITSNVQSHWDETKQNNTQIVKAHEQQCDRVIPTLNEVTETPANVDAREGARQTLWLRIIK